MTARMRQKTRRLKGPESVGDGDGILDLFVRVFTGPKPTVEKRVVLQRHEHTNAYNVAGDEDSASGSDESEAGDSDNDDADDVAVSESPRKASQRWIPSLSSKQRLSCIQYIIHCLR